MSFVFRGEIPASKSVLIRCLLAQAYAPELTIRRDSLCEDVVAMRGAVAAWRARSPRIHCGEAGLVFRLILGLVSRTAGEFLLTGSAKLLQRPHGALLEILSRFGVRSEWAPEGLRIRSEGWKDPGGPVAVDLSVSSQFASALVLNSWELPFDVEYRFGGDPVSLGYLEMTLRMARELGMCVDETSSGLRVQAGARIRSSGVEAELDFSSAFAVAALGAVAGEAEIRNFATQSEQPDRIFPEILHALGIMTETAGDRLLVRRTDRFRPIHWNLKGSPDLFPVLSVICGLAEGRSVLYGAPHLLHKESNRIDSVARLLQAMGREVQVREDGLEIFGRPLEADLGREARKVDPEKDHRLVMASAVARAAGLPIQVMAPGAVRKSFPEFLDIAREYLGGHS